MQTFRTLHALLSPAAVLALFLPLLPLSSGCSNTMDPKECDKIRSDAFDVLNKAQHCNEDKDCRASEFPACAKPLSSESFAKIAAMREAFVKGKCEQSASACSDTTPIYCKQGLCARREKGVQEGASGTPSEAIIVK